MKSYINGRVNHLSIAVYLRVSTSRQDLDRHLNPCGKYRFDLAVPWALPARGIQSEEYQRTGLHRDFL